MSRPIGRRDAPADEYAFDFDAAEPRPARSSERDATSRLLRELLVATREMIALSREQLELAKKSEERYQRQLQGQREEFERWLGENDLDDGRCVQAENVLRTLLGGSMRAMIDQIDDDPDAILESDFARNELVDRFGPQMGHLSTLYNVVKRLNLVDRTRQESERTETET
jgi:hypothetical protein